MTAPDNLLGVVDLHCNYNNTAHHTDEIDSERLVVRRGQPFTITVECRSGLFHPGRDQLAIVLDIGQKPSTDNGTRIKISSSDAKAEKWRFAMQADQYELQLTLYSPADAPVGQYTILLLVHSDSKLIQKKAAGQFYLLFNPWCKDDTVYLPDKEMLNEYIMNENGQLYQGSWNDIYPVSWNFGQFEKDVVDICFEILDNSLPALNNPVADILKRKDPIYVSRIVSAMVNANDDKGVLLGRWDGNYFDGIPPTRWNGSVQILRQWSKSGAKKVRYGQCWVFAGLACTVLRCLGIPTRCITNYYSAHDTDGNLKVDKCFNEDLDVLPGKRKDMIWNFHCWVESWMTRQDLPSGYDGWQVLDPTPQERSDGIYCCGPCPIKAIKEGNINVKYDASFVFAEVNADVTCYIVKKDGTKSETAVYCHQVGKCISTKSIFGDNREDITEQYKYPEGSSKEREVYAKAGLKNRLVSSNTKDVLIAIKHTRAVHGSDFDIFIEVCNNSSVDKDVGVTIVAKTVTYNGIILKDCHKKITSFSLMASNAKKEVFRLKYEHYGEHLSEHNLIRITALLLQKGKNELILTERDIALAMPQLTVKILGEPMVSRKLKAHIKFVNPLPITLTDGIFTVEGAGLTDLQEIKCPGKIKPGEEVTVDVSFIPTKTGLRKLLVDFDTSRLRDVKGYASVIIKG
nr:PREDICTED: protein-glutamine gamma-glutamyltransferase 2-like [Latimeria chalumnae]|eukprot:XP_005997256.1 PREDICTED: protein-glutamine gamma-glutamyltransferase 2-like [Latimeria chalumnae]